MTDLAARDAWDGALPVEAEGCRLEALDMVDECLTLLAPYPGQRAKMEAELRFALPEPGASWSDGARFCFWFGREQALLVGTPPKASGYGMVQNVTDAWAAARLRGAAALDVLARLVPVDLRGLATNGAVRTMLGHMQVAIVKRDGAIDLYVMRSMAGTFAHEIADAMARVDARERLG